MDAGGETYSLQNFGSVNVAKEYVQAQSPSFAAIERDSQFILTINESSEKHFRIPSPQSSPVSGARRTQASAFNVGR
jgi:hypothetical protein